MKKNLAMLAFAALGFAAITFTGCKDTDPVKVSSISVTPATPTLEIGETQQLQAVVLPADADNKSVTWSSNNNDAATVNASTGLVTAVGQGTATITATAADGSDKTGIATVTVNPAETDPVLTITGEGFDIDEVLTIKASQANSTDGFPVQVNIVASEGIAEMKVAIDSSSPTFLGNLAGMGMDEEFDLANPSTELAGLLGDLQILPYGDAVKGKTTLPFDITTFIPLIFMVTEAEGTDLTAEFTLTVVDEEGADESKTLSLSLIRDVQLPNAGFEVATNNGTGIGNIGWYFYADFENRTDKFWDNGNAGTAAVQGVGKSVTTSVEGHSGKGVEMKSQFIGVTSPFFTAGAFAAGNLYSGDFGLTRADLSNPSGTVHFGQPFTSRPSALSVWYKATAGTITHAKAGAPLAIGDTDKYQIFIALVDGADYNPTAEGADGGDHWHTVDTADLERTAIDYTTDERVIGYGSFDSDESIADWTQKTIEIEYRSDRTPTHIVVVASASMYGDYFTGSTSSVLTVDDFEALYE